MFFRFSVLIINLIAISSLAEISAAYKTCTKAESNLSSTVSVDYSIVCDLDQVQSKDGSVKTEEASHVFLSKSVCLAIGEKESIGGEIVKGLDYTFSNWRDSDRSFSHSELGRYTNFLIFDEKTGLSVSGENISASSGKFFTIDVNTNKPSLVMATKNTILTTKNCRKIEK